MSAVGVRMDGVVNSDQSDGSMWTDLLDDSGGW